MNNPVNLFNFLTLYFVFQSETLADIRRLALPGDIREKATVALEAVHEQDKMFREQTQAACTSHDMGEGPSHTQDMGEGPSETQDMGETVTQIRSQRQSRSHRPKQVVPRKRRWRM